jgi:hypothetical protein
MVEEDEWAKKVGLDGFKHIRWGTLRRDLVADFIRGLDLSFNAKVIKSIVEGRIITINQELIVEFLGLPHNFSHTQIPGFASDEWGEHVSHISGANSLIRE